MKRNRNLKDESKSPQLISVLQQTLAGKMNLARIKFFGMFICALCRVQTVSFEKLAIAFETGAKSGSSLRRIQRFMAEYVLNTDLIARLIFKMLPHKPPYRQTIRWFERQGLHEGKILQYYRTRLMRLVARRRLSVFYKQLVLNDICRIAVIRS
jgi:hypothetical protein